MKKSLLKAVILSACVCCQVFGQRVNSPQKTYAYEPGFANSFLILTPEKFIVAINGKLLLAGSIEGDLVREEKTIITGIAPFISEKDTCFILTQTSADKSFLLKNRHAFKRESQIVTELPHGIYCVKSYHGKAVYIYGSWHGMGVIYRFNQNGLRKIFETREPVTELCIEENGSILAAAQNKLMRLGNDNTAPAIIHSTKAKIDGLATDHKGNVFVSTVEGIIRYRNNEKQIQEKVVSSTHHGSLEILGNELFILSRAENRIITQKIGFESLRTPQKNISVTPLFTSDEKKRIQAFELNRQCELTSLQGQSGWSNVRLQQLESVEKTLGQATPRTQFHRTGIAAEELNLSILQLSTNLKYDYNINTSRNTELYNMSMQGIDKVQMNINKYLELASPKDLNFTQVPVLQNHLITTRSSLLHFKAAVVSYNSENSEVYSNQAKLRKVKRRKIVTLIAGIASLFPALLAVDQYLAHKSYVNFLKGYDVYDDLPDAESQLKRSTIMSASLSTLSLGLLTTSFSLRPKKYKRAISEGQIQVEQSRKQIQINTSFKVGYSLTEAGFKVTF